MSDEWKWDSEIWPFLFEGNSRSIEESILLLVSLITSSARNSEQL
jgi:hypothetical protein